MAAKAAGLKLITWTLERSGERVVHPLDPNHAFPKTGLLSTGGGFYYDTVASITKNDGDAFEALHALVKEVRRVF
jgi:glycerophosphoryl diester phosphodiesterase